MLGEGARFRPTWFLGRVHLLPLPPFLFSSIDFLSRSVPLHMVLQLSPGVSWAVPRRSHWPALEIEGFSSLCCAEGYWQKQETRNKKHENLSLSFCARQPGTPLTSA